MYSRKELKVRKKNCTNCTTTTVFAKDKRRYLLCDNVLACHYGDQVDQFMHCGCWKEEAK